MRPEAETTMSQERIDYFFSPAAHWLVVAVGFALVGMCAWVVFTIPIAPLQWGLAIFAIPFSLYLIWIAWSRLSRMREPALTLFGDRLVARVFKTIDVMFSEIASAEVPTDAPYSGAPHLVLRLKGRRAGETIAINLSPIKGDAVLLLDEVRTRIAAWQ